MSSEDDGLVRLQKFISSCGLSSRRKAEELITQGKVKVNGLLVTQLGTKIDPLKDTVLVDGVPVSPEQKRLFIFHKPKGVVSTLSDPQKRPCLGDYVDKLSERVFPVGRLDSDVSGLMVLTNDGEYANQLAHPRYKVPRKYLAIVEGQHRSEAFIKLISGIRLEDGHGRADGIAVIEDRTYAEFLFGPIRPSRSVVEIVVSEGRKHFVKRLLAAIDKPVLRLARIEFGDFRLGRLAPGVIHELSRSNAPKGF